MVNLNFVSCSLLYTKLSSPRNQNQQTSEETELRKEEKRREVKNPKSENESRSEIVDMEGDFLWEEEDFWKCRKHPSQPRSGVCPACLRDRLLLLCPDCANVRPCSCFTSSLSSSSSFSSLSSSDPARSSVSAGIGAVDRVSNLIESEPAFRRSRSAAFPFLRPRSDVAADAERGGRQRLTGGKMWGSFWPFSKATARKVEEEEARRSEREKFSRSRSVGVTIFPDSGGGDGRLKGWKWHFPSPMRAFQHWKSAKVIQERSPLCRG